MRFKLAPRGRRRSAVAPAGPPQKEEDEARPVQKSEAEPVPAPNTADDAGEQKEEGPGEIVLEEESAAVTENANDKLLKHPHIGLIKRLFEPDTSGKALELFQKWKERYEAIYACTLGGIRVDDSLGLYCSGARV